MFAIYTPQGRSFSGTLERLRKIERTAQSQSSRSPADHEADLIDQHSVEAYQISDKAITQYRSMLPQKQQRDPIYHAYQVMSQPVQTLNGDWSLARTKEAFQQFSYAAFPVINNRMQLTGLLSRGDFYEHLATADFPPRLTETSINESFIRSDNQVYAAEPITDIRRIAWLLFNKRLTALPIVEDTGRLIGIVSRSDILHCTINDPPLSLWC
ncbi:MAG: hypothetical protein AseanaTS_07400 [Candidatus Pelagadaptatus aseana]|uniref:CBS domain-containing protein n=1 Tax=Candidatus Pelagadaptatus aseana TaxID=3120508 RepID=UPI0039B1B694